MIKPIAALSLAALTLPLAACGSSSDKLDAGRIEKGITQGVEQQNPGTKVAAVNCPNDIKKKKGTTFTCQVKLQGSNQKATATVTQTDDKGQVRYVVR
jgi:hypothetical protein